jgi:hypothetical protein
MTSFDEVLTSVDTKYFVRGVPRIGNGPALGAGANISELGWSGGGTWKQSVSGAGGDGTAYLGYHYLIGSTSIGSGLSGNLLTNHRFRDALEAYLQVISGPLLLGICPGATFYCGLTDGLRTYGELKFSRLSSFVGGRTGCRTICAFRIWELLL